MSRYTCVNFVTCVYDLLRLDRLSYRYSTVYDLNWRPIPNQGMLPSILNSTLQAVTYLMQLHLLSRQFLPFSRTLLLCCYIPSFIFFILRILSLPLFFLYPCLFIYCLLLYRPRRPSLIPVLTPLPPSLADLVWPHAGAVRSFLGGKVAPRLLLLPLVFVLLFLRGPLLVFVLLFLRGPLLVFVLLFLRGPLLLFLLLFRRGLRCWCLCSCSLGGRCAGVRVLIPCRNYSAPRLYV